MRNSAVTSLAALALACSSVPAFAVTELQWWHPLGGALGERAAELVEQFNASQSEYKVLSIYKGSPPEAMLASIAAFRARRPPHIAQVYELGVATMMAATGAIKPVHELMAQQNSKLSGKDFLPAIASYYSDTQGRLLSMPFNSSTPVLFYNKDLLAKAGLNPEAPPKTWPEMAAAARKIVESGAAPCGFTTGWPAWVLIETFSTWHNLPFSTKSNGFEEGPGAMLTVNSAAHVKNLQAFVDWQKDSTFRYGGDAGNAHPKFLSGECAMMTQSSSFYASAKKDAAFQVGVGQLPYWPEYRDAPQNTLLGGASLWVFNGFTPAEYRGIAKFFEYLNSTPVQERWHKETGYMPVTNVAYESLKTSGYYKENPSMEVPVLQMVAKAPTPNSAGLRLGNLVQIRDAIREEMEAAFANRKTSKQALDAAVTRGNELLRRFEQNR